jgi:hypothetical protein
MYIIKEIKNSEIWYHGSDRKITSWSTEFTGKGTDQDGAGIYFTTDEEDAQIYGKHVQKVSLEFKKQMSLKAKPIKREIEQLIKKAPNYKDTLMDFAEDEKEAFIKAVNNYIEYNDTHWEAVKFIEADFYRREGDKYCKAMTSLGYDGVIIDINYNNILHAVVWNPKIIKGI